MSSGYDSREPPAVHGDRAGEDEARRAAKAAAALEQLTGRVEIDGEAQVEVGLGLATQHGREVEHEADVGINDRAHEFRIGDGSHAILDSRIDERARHQIGSDDRRDGSEARGPCGERPNQLLSEKAGGAGDEDLHVVTQSQERYRGSARVMLPFGS